VFLFPEH